jgi:hypothetical protein
MPLFKYQAKLVAYPDCPAPDCQEGSRDAYRYVFRDRMAESFTPIGVPDWGARWDDKTKCAGWALSFFTSMEGASTHFEKLRKTTQNISKKVGDAIASGRLGHQDGRMSEAEPEGHFELHEYEGTELAMRFNVVRILA